MIQIRESSRRASPGSGIRRAGARGALRIAVLVGGAAAALTACTGTGVEPSEQEIPLRQAAVVVNSIGGTLSLVGRNADGVFLARNDVAELGPAANAVDVAIAEGVAAVPVGGTDSLLVFEVDTLDAMVRRRCGAGLTPGGSPSNVAIAEGKAYVTELVAGRLARVDLDDCGVEAEAPVGPGPVGVRVRNGTAVVVVGNLDFSTGDLPPRLGPSYVAFVDPVTLAVEDTAGTGGFNAQFAAFDRDGDLLVTNSGDFGEQNGSLAVLDFASHHLVAGPFPLGEFPVEIAIGQGNLAYVSSFSDGLYVFDASANRVLRGPEDPLRPPDAGGSRRGSSGVAVAQNGQVLSTFFGFDAATPGKVFAFDPSGALADSATVGFGPVGLAIVPLDSGL